jgi:precorrin-6Y C5,15-methyltransferase (decarboxylating)
VTEPDFRADLGAVRVVVVGIGADGWDGLSDPARRSLTEAEVVLGSGRQLALMPVSVAARREEWPSPLVPALPEVLSRSAGQRTCVLASGDPMFYGIGGTLIRLLGAAAVDVIVHPSSVSLACARLGWPLEEVEVITAVGRPLTSIAAALQPGLRLLVLVGDPSAGASIADLLVERGFGGSVLTALSRLGAFDEVIVTDLARDWAGDHDPLTVVAIEARLDPGAVSYGRTPGLPDDAFEHDGQLTKQEIRSLTLSTLAPNPGELLWDIGAGSGSIGIEWMRCHPANRAIGIERDPERTGSGYPPGSSRSVPRRLR